MTGIFVRIYRDGAWKAIEIEELTEAELGALEREKPLDGWRWTAALTKWIREKVRPVAEIQAYRPGQD